MNKADRKKVLEVIRLLESDYGYDAAMETLYGMVRPLTSAEVKALEYQYDETTDEKEQRQ